MSFRAAPKLSQEVHDQIVALDGEGKNRAQIAKKLHISTWAVNRHLEAAAAQRNISVVADVTNYSPETIKAAVAMQEEEFGKYQPPQIDAPWQRLEGFFWLYFNTRRGKGHLPKNATPKQLAWKDAAWIIRKFRTHQDMMNYYPVVGTFEDILAHEFKVDMDLEFLQSHMHRELHAELDKVPFEATIMQTVYLENPPWKNQRTSIQWVRGFLRFAGVLEWR